MKFELDETETAKAKEFMTKHKGCPSDTIGAKFTFKFMPTGLGNISSLECSCGVEIELTNYDKL